MKLPWRRDARQTPEPAAPQGTSFDRLDDVDDERLEELLGVDQEKEDAVPSRDEASPSPAPMVSAAERYCDLACPLRETCATRQGFLHLAQASDTLQGGFSAEEFPDLHDDLHHLDSLVSYLQESRDACATDKLTRHEARLVEEERVTKLMEAAIQRALGASLSEVRAKLASLPTAAATNEPLGPLGPLGEADEDAAAWSTIREYRERFPDDDAEAARHLLTETRLTQNLISRIAQEHGLPGWSKGNLTNWRNPDAKATTSLNKERLLAAPAPPPADATG